MLTHQIGDYTPRGVCDTTRKISWRTRSSSSLLIDGLILSRSTRPAARLRRGLLRPRHSCSAGNPRRQKLRILLDEAGQKFSDGLLAALSARNQAAVFRAHDPVLHGFISQIHFRDSQLLQFRPDVRAALRFVGHGPAALVLFHEFVHALLELFPPPPLFLQLGLVSRLAPRHILPHVFVDRLLHDRLYVYCFAHSPSPPLSALRLDTAASISSAIRFLISCRASQRYFSATRF